MNNLIEYYEGLGGSEEQVSKYKVESNLLKDLLLTRKHNIDIGNIIDLDYQEEVKVDISELETLLNEADSQTIHRVKRKHKSVQAIFDLKMENNVVMNEWKEATRKELEQLKNRITQKEESLK